MRYLLTFLLMCAAASGQVQFATNLVLFPDTGFPSGTNARTLTYWLDTSTGDSSTRHAFGYGSAGTIGAFFSSGILDGQVFITQWGSSIRSGSVVGQKVFIASVHSHPTTYLFTNATLAKQTNFVSFNTTLRHCVIGGRTNTSGSGYVDFLIGRIEDARIYSRALSASEIRSIYERPWSLADDPALVLRTCIERGDTGAALSGTARNYGTGADGIYSNAPTVAPGRIQTIPPMEEE
jgi:hypothetical protein